MVAIAHVNQSSGIVQSECFRFGFDWVSCRFIVWGADAEVIYLDVFQNF